MVDSVLLVGRELVLPFQLQFELGNTFSFAIELLVKVADSVPAGIGDQHKAPTAAPPRWGQWLTFVQPCS